MIRYHSQPWLSPILNIKDSVERLNWCIKGMAICIQFDLTLKLKVVKQYQNQLQASPYVCIRSAATATSYKKQSTALLVCKLQHVLNLFCCKKDNETAILFLYTSYVFQEPQTNQMNTSYVHFCLNPYLIYVLTILREMGFVRKIWNIFNANFANSKKGLTFPKACLLNQSCWWKSFQCSISHSSILQTLLCMRYEALHIFQMNDRKSRYLVF